MSRIVLAFEYFVDNWKLRYYGETTEAIPRQMLRQRRCYDLEYSWHMPGAELDEG